ncbi:uncharacterized protein LOC100119245 [Nasonia vitripennis]|uniref:Kazal-like domain-containing protein n=2 Tax=Pteromalinae TaxID=272242 RepID=A0A7M7G2M4_NASVI|nr:uncharacterized protein LOC100119245 [Nasonia vitripennis]OXU28749.1 hypothetical protein TSAR_006184 [Trichomalopsis sarcophagae]
MKLAFALGAVLLVCLVCSIEAGPTEKPVTTAKPTASKEVKDAIKNAKEAKKAKKDCLKSCPTDYVPICAHDPANASFKPRTFGNQCVLDTHNCEMGTKLVMKMKGECPGSDGVRL